MAVRAVCNSKRLENLQMRGLLAGTTSWGQAVKNIFADLTLKAIQSFEKMAVDWAAMELAKTGATSAGVAARNAVESAGAAVSSLAQIGNATGVIIADAAKTFAGIFGFLAPTMGPAAAGPAAAGGATVLGALGAIPAADVGGYVVEPGWRKSMRTKPSCRRGLISPTERAPTGGGHQTFRSTSTHNGSLSYADIQAHARTIAQAVEQQIFVKSKLQLRCASCASPPTKAQPAPSNSTFRRAAT